MDVVLALLSLAFWVIVGWWLFRLCKKWMLTRRGSNEAAATIRREAVSKPPRVVPSNPHRRWRDDGIRTQIVGESHYQRALRVLSAKRPPDQNYTVEEALINLDDGNKYDAQAVAITIGGSTVGYLARDDARRYRRLLERRNLGDMPIAAKALIRGGYTREGKRLDYNVHLLFDLDDPALE